MKHIEYVAGFLFDNAKKNVALIRKNRPDFMKGTWNAIGGKIENDETSYMAMVREFKEETNLLTNQYSWAHFCTLIGDTWATHFFYGYTPVLGLVKTITDEEVIVFPIEAVWSLPSLPNLNWLLGLALDDSITVPLIINQYR